MPIRRLFVKGEKPNFFLWYVIAILLIFLFSYIYVDNNRVQVQRQRITVATLPKGLEGYTVLHVSDLNGKRFGAMQSLLISTISSQKFDCILMTGDMAGEDPQPFFELLAGLEELRKPIFFITGDSDPTPLDAAHNTDGKVLASFIEKAQSLGATYLDAPVRVKTGSASVWLWPAFQMSWDDDTMEANLKRQREEAQAKNDGAKDLEIAYQQEMLSRLREAREEIQEEDVHIGLLHYPMSENFMVELQKWADSESGAFLRRMDLVLAGHFNAGQWRIPLLGALHISADYPLPRNGFFPNQHMVSGLMSVNGIHQYTSPGLGVSNKVKLPPIRLFNTPTITLLELTNKLN